MSFITSDIYGWFMKFTIFTDPHLKNYSWFVNESKDVYVLTEVRVSCRQQSEEGDKNGSEEEDEEKPGKRVMGPRKKFVWDDKLR